MEEYTIRIALNSNLTSSSSESNITLSTNVEVDVDDITSIINDDHRTSIRSPKVETYKTFKQIFHFLVLFISLFVTIYEALKFSIVLQSFITTQSADLEYMNIFFFSTLAAGFGFSILEFLNSTFSWLFMGRLTKIVIELKNKLNNTDEILVEQQQEPKTANLRRLLALSFPERYLLCVAFLMILVSSCQTIVLPFYIGAIIDAAINFPDLTEMNRYIILISIILFIGSIAEGISSWLFDLAGERFVARLRKNLFRSISKQDIKFFDTNKTGEITSRINSDTQVLQSAVTSNIDTLFNSLLQIVGSVIFMFSLQASLTG